MRAFCASLTGDIGARGRCRAKSKVASPKVSAISAIGETAPGRASARLASKKRAAFALQKRQHSRPNLGWQLIFPSYLRLLVIFNQGFAAVFHRFFGLRMSTQLCRRRLSELLGLLYKLNLPRAIHLPYRQLPISLHSPACSISHARLPR